MESVTQVSLNYSNAGGGHSASVDTTLDTKNVQGENLGTVVGGMGEPPSFSNEKIQRMFQNFVCTQIIKSRDSVKTTLSRKYVDKTSLILKSYVVLVRGVNCSPREGLEFEGEVPYFTEVINSPHPLYDSDGRSFPFPSLGPVLHGSVIAAGKIYNYESAAEYGGAKMNLIYNNMELKEDLSLNDEAVSADYKLSPDLSQYDLKYGYTLDDVNKMLKLVGLTVNNFPSGEGTESILFEANGTLGSVLGNVASYLGYFWYVNPEDGTINFINTEQASQIPIEDPTLTSDANVISAAYTKSLATSKLVNVYSGTSEKKDDKSPKDDDRPRPIFFKRYYIEDEAKFVATKMRKVELGVWFSIFNQGETTDIFDKYTYILTYLNKRRGNRKAQVEAILGKQIDAEEFYSGFDKTSVDEEGEAVEDGSPFNTQQWAWGPSSKFKKPWIWASEDKADEHKDTTKLKFDRVKNQFTYMLCNYKLRGKMPKPSQDDLYEFLNTYFAIAGGIYISNGYTKYKADRMEFQNMNNITVVGPFKGGTKLEDIDELSQINDILKILKIEGRTIKQMSKLTKGESKATSVGAHFFVAVRNIPKLERHNGELADRAVDWKPFATQLEFYEHPRKVNKLWLGGPKKAMDGFSKLTLNNMAESYQNFKTAIETKKTLRLEYVRRKTRVNKTPEESEEAEDDEIAKDRSGTESKMSDIFERFDYRYYSVEAPTYNLLNNLSISNSSGSTVEMLLLKKVRGSYGDVSGDKPVSSTKVLYGLHVPEYTPTMSAVTFAYGSNGITTNVSESSIKLIPPDQNFLMTKGQEAFVNSEGITSILSAFQKNYLGV